MVLFMNMWYCLWIYGIVYEFIVLIMNIWYWSWIYGIVYEYMVLVMNIRVLINKYMVLFMNLRVLILNIRRILINEYGGINEYLDNMHLIYNGYLSYWLLLHLIKHKWRTLVTFWPTLTSCKQLFDWNYLYEIECLTCFSKSVHYDTRLMRNIVHFHSPNLSLLNYFAWSVVNTGQ